ncbi:hypothetical protein PLICRDRAFT_103539 [Plicaturopsis crispa FD-325 SS-3]|nr:hypothetical protein PLICRDRAFT_103539 [Plicaturopsis crispa FD-325 SS-3]
MCLYRELSSAKPILIQETVADDPWKIIIATVLLNKTTGRAAIPVFRSLIALYPDPQALANASVDDLAALLQPLGLFNIRAKRLIDISKVYIADPPDPGRLRVSKNKLYIPVEKHISPSPLPYPPTPISHIPGTGPYALDSYRIFCGKDDEWMQVLPSDKELIRYLKWKWAYDKGMRWFAGAGACGDVDHDYLVELTTDLNNTIP